MTPLGRYLETLRRRRGLQQSQLAAEVGVQPCYISAMENGRKGPASPPIMSKIIQALELTPSEEQALALGRIVRHPFK
ncbi:helix-turn-helix domain-containing protein [Teredinibacter turnerae]|uniref:helix-turn-helix domain-containing protein n=1 Tax=Teredinibacter turnerae TaxID=2426 RepID=UPI003BB05BFD